MTTNLIRPLHDWQRHHPTAKAIAGDLLAAPALLSLRTRALEPAIRQRYGVGKATAMRAVGMARRGG